MVGTQMIQQVYIPCTIKKMTFEVETRSLNILVWYLEIPMDSLEGPRGLMYPSLIVDTIRMQ